MKQIYRFPIPLNDEFQIGMPKDAEILHLGTQNGIPCLWVMVETDNDYVERSFRGIGTGHTIKDPLSSHTLKYIGTCLLKADMFVYHVFEVC